MKIISGFQGKFRFLSNFWPCEINFEGENYQSTESAYQAAKTLDEHERKEIREAATPAIAKKFGRKCTIRSDWEKIKLSVMENLLRQKFQSGSDLFNKLKETFGMEIIESNYWHDNFFGSCTCEKCGNKGRNELGKLLMKIRDK